MHRYNLAFLLIPFLLMPMLTTVMLATAAEPDFENEVAPILEMRCLSCHDASNSKGDVRLDLREFALKAI